MIVSSYSDINIEDPSLRPYQQKAKKEIFEAWDKVDNVMFQMPTGTGKTRLFTSIIRDINEYSKKIKEPVKILVIAHRTELIDQIDESLTKYHVPHNVIAGGRQKRIKFPVNVASIQTLTNRSNIGFAKKLNVQFIIIDEAHHALASTYQKLWDLYPGSKKLGVTATPWRMNHKGFTDLFDTLIMSMPIKDFIKQGYLSSYKYYSLRSDSDIQKTIDGIELDRFGEYSESSMEEKMDIGSIRAQLLDSYQTLAKGKKGIIYAINIEHARHICKVYEKAGYVAVCIDSKTPASERKELVEKFRKGQIDIIVNVDIFSEGFDCPDIEFIQLARPTRSLAKYLQQVGRGLRITEDKEECVILDNVGMYTRFGLPNARRYWKQHFLGINVSEEPKSNVSKGAGMSRNPDMSEGTEDMVLIQDINEEQTEASNVTAVDSNAAEVVSNAAEKKSNVSGFNDFFPLFGITLGKTTWKQAEDAGYEVKIWKEGPSRTIDINNISFWDDKGCGIFTSLFWINFNHDFPESWKLMGFSWKNSYNTWLSTLRNLGFTIEVKEEPKTEFYNDQKTLSAEIGATSKDGLLEFDFDFDFGEDGYETSSPKSLYSITINYLGNIAEENKDFFPLFGITLGKTTWRQAEDAGYKVKIWGKGPARTIGINSVDFWDHKGCGRFTSLYWVQYDADFPDSWKLMGFSWENSYNTWLDTLRRLGFTIIVTEQPKTKLYNSQKTLSAEIEATSNDGLLEFDLDFDYGEDGFYKSSPKTLYSISIDYLGHTCEDDNDSFSIFGVTLGKTTWKQAKELGYKVKKEDDGSSRYIEVNGIDVWDDEGSGKLSEIYYWTKNDSDFPDNWKSNGFSWSNSYDEWLNTLNGLGFKITILIKPQMEYHSGYKFFKASVEATSKDGLLEFGLNFDYGNDGYETSSPNTLYSISVYYLGNHKN